MITLYESNITSFPVDNGIGVLRDAVKAFAEEELNGIFEFEMEYDSEGHLVDELKEERIIKAKAQDKLGYQLFRIYSITKSHESDNLIIKGQHITYDLANNFIKELNANNVTKQQVMQLIGSSAVTPHTFNITSPNNTTRSTTKLYRTNPLQMVGGMQGSVLQIWGGQIERDNFNLILHDKRGHDDGVEVTYEKNITGLEAVFDISNVVTRIFPFVFKEATENEPEKLITITGEYINSPLINDYKIIRTQPIDFSSDDRINLDGTDAQIRTQLTNLANAYFDETGNDKAKVELDVNFSHLWETEEYKDVAPLELVGMGDTVTINHSKLKVYATATVNYIRYDCIAQVNEEVKLGSVKARLSDKVNKVEEAIQKVEQIESNVNQVIVNIGGKNKTYYGPDEPTNDMQKGDLWFKVVDGEYTQTYRYDGIEWQLIVDLDSQEAKAEAEEAKQSAQTAVETANQSKAEAESAISKANESFGKAENALASSSMALQQSADAYDKSLDAFDKAEDGLAQANTALSKAQEGFDLAQQNAEEIEGIGLRIGDVEEEFTTISGNVQGLQTQVGNIAGDLSTVTQTANANQQQIQNARGDINSLTQTATAMQNRLSNAEGDINTITNLATGTQQSLVNLQGDFTRLNTTVGGLQTEVEKKVDSTTYNTKMIQLDNAISQRVTKTDANNLYTQKTEFNQFADGFSQRVDAIENWEIGGRNLFTSGGWSFYTPYATEIESNGTTYLKFKEIGTGGIIAIRNLGYTSKDGTYTLSGRVKIDGQIPNSSYFRNISSRGSSDTKVNYESETGYFAITQTVNDYSWTIHASVSGQSNRTIELFDIQLEKGNKATDYQPAPEDTDQKFTAITQTIDNIDQRVQTNSSNYSSISQTVQGIQNTVKDKANQSEVTQLSNLLNTTITNKADKSEVTQLATLVDTKVTSSQVNSLIASDKQIKDTRNDNQKPSWYFSNYPRQTVREFKQNSVLGISSDGTYGVLETAIQWSNTSGGKVKQILYTDAATYERRGNNTNDTWESWKKVADVDYVEGRITVLNNAINLRVKEGEVLSQINIEANRTLIQSNKLILDADTVTVTGTFRVNNANISSVDAGKMTTGTLNAAQVNIINMNASNITSGTINTDNITIRGGSTTDYTMIDGSRLESRGRYNMRWHNKSKIIDASLYLANGNFRVANWTDERSIFLTPYGLSTFADGYGDGTSSGMLEFFSEEFESNTHGITLASQLGVTGIKSFQNRVFVDAYTSVNIESRQSAVYIRPARDASPGSNVFRFTLSGGTVAANVDGYLLYGSESDPHASGFRLSKRKSDPRIQVVDSNYTTGGNTTIEAGVGEFNEIKRRSTNSNISIAHANLLTVGDDSQGGRLSSIATYNRPYSAAANVHMTNQGTFGRATSARKYKRDIEHITTEYAYNFFNNINPVFYRPHNTADDNKDYSHYGYIADDVALIEPRLVQFGQNGEAESFSYDRVPTLLHVVLKNEISRIDELEKTVNEQLTVIENLVMKNAQLEQRINELESAA